MSTLFNSPFTIDLEDVETELQCEVAELQCDEHLKSRFASDLIHFYKSLDNNRNLRTQIIKLLVIFDNIYRCEQAFSIMNNIKTQK